MTRPPWISVTTAAIVMLSAACQSDPQSEPQQPCASATGPSWPGDFEAHNAADVETLAELACISGDLRIEETALVELSLPALTEVGGEVSITGNADLIAVDMPALARAGRLTVGSSSDTLCGLEELALPALAIIDTELVFIGAEHLVTIELPSVAEIGNRLFIGPNPLQFPASQLIAIDLPLLGHTGSVFVWGPLLEELSLPALHTVDHHFTADVGDGFSRLDARSLRSVGAELRIGAGALLRDIELPELVSVGDGFGVCATELTTLSLPALETVGTGWEPPEDAPTMEIECPSLRSLLLPSLSEVGGNLLVVDSVGITSLELPSLTRVGAGFGLRDNRNLATIEAPRLETVGWGLSLFGNTTLDALDFPAIVRIGSVLDISGDQGLSNRALTAIKLPSLESVGGFLRIAGSPLLTSLDLDALSALGGDLYVLSNDRLPTCAAEALRDQLRAAGWTGDAEIVGNDDSGPCE